MSIDSSMSGKNVLGQPVRGPARAEDQRERGDDHGEPVRQHPAQQLRVAVGEPVDGRFDLRGEATVLGVAEEVAARHRRDGHADEVRRDHRDGDGDGERREELAGQAGEQDDRQQHRHRRERRREHRQGDGVGALEGRLGRAHAHALVPVDGFEHDDGVVDEAPHRERQTAEREGVERLPGGVEDDERDGERERDGDRDDQRARGSSGGRAGSPAR